MLNCNILPDVTCVQSLASSGGCLGRQKCASFSRQTFWTYRNNSNILPHINNNIHHVEETYIKFVIYYFWFPNEIQKMSANSFVQQLKWNTNIAQKMSVILKSILMSNQQTTICFLFLACWRVSSRSFLAVSLQEEINVFTVGPTPHSPTTLTAAAAQTHTGRNCRGTSRLFIYPFICLFVCSIVL